LTQGNFCFFREGLGVEKASVFSASKQNLAVFDTLWASAIASEDALLRDKVSLSFLLNIVNVFIIFIINNIFAYAVARVSRLRKICARASQISAAIKPVWLRDLDGYLVLVSQLSPEVSLVPIEGVIKVGDPVSSLSCCVLWVDS
jgi:hypothetical protein